MNKQSWPAADRNKGPILEVLRRVLPARGIVLEIGSGTGQHAVYFAEHLPALVFQPSDAELENLGSIRAWVEDARLANLRLPFHLDVRAPDWSVGKVEAVYSANMIHIAPWECAESLFTGMGRHLADSGVCVLYGPFRVGGSHTAPSNAAFDADLRARDASFGVRDKEAVEALAERVGLVLVECVEMPANNLSLVFRRSSRIGAPPPLAPAAASQRS